MLLHAGTSQWARDCSALRAAAELPGGARAFPGARRTLLLVPAAQPLLAACGPAFCAPEPDASAAAAAADAQPPPLLLHPLPLPAGEALAAVALGWEHAMLVTAAGSLYCLGEGGGSGCLGLGASRGSAAQPARVHLQGLAVRAVACGEAHTVALVEGGQLYSWGSARRGALGQDGDCGGSGSSSAAPCALPAPAAAANALLGAGEAYCALAAGQAHTLALSSAGRCAVWGANRHGQCARAPCSAAPPAWVAPALLPLPVAAVAAGWSHCACASAGAPQVVVTWGRSDLGQVGQGSGAGGSAGGRAAAPQPVQGLQCECASASASASAGSAAGAPLPPRSPLACGAESTAYALPCGRCLYTWGWNEHGNLAVGDEVTRVQPAKVPLPPQLLGAGGRVAAVLAAGATLLVEVA